ncbi:MAG: tetratricopeptide repeat protein [Planctomycetes bacterium]|nr:tetratricopeptide repeat protein [Planctomycetota bacterium]
MMPSPCPSDVALDRYAAGVLSEAEAQTIDLHLAGCAACLSRLDALAGRPDSLVAALRRPGGSTGPDNPALAQAVAAVLNDVAPTQAGAAPGPEAGAVLSGYRVLEELGRGGMGRVYRALHPRLGQEVALKVLHPGMDSAPILARFEAERQTLARMDYPHIARILDGGATEDGRPFFVMELVHGCTLTDYCDEHRLDVRRRLELFATVCRAVQHAHQKGVIHRDLKPSNVLVAEYEGVAVPKVIDFGVARAIEGRSTAATEVGMVVGTPEYMSPEQADLQSQDIDTRSDIYSLGVLLYELLTGDTPLARQRVREAPLLEVLRAIREEEPPAPSTRLLAAETLVEVAAQRSSDPGRLARQVRGELDWIVMKCLEKERNRRYETANALALDLQRYLADEPVFACPPSTAYRVRKFVRRHKGPVLASALVLLVLVGGIIGTTWGMLRAKKAEVEARGAETEALEAQGRAAADRDLAREAEADTRAFSDFLVADVLAAPRPAGLQLGQGRDITLARALEHAEEGLAKRFADRPLAEATARHALGVTWRNLAKYPRAEGHLRRALALRLRLLGPEHRDTLNTQNSLGVLLTEMDRAAEAVPLLQKVLEAKRAQLGPDDSDTLLFQTNLGRALAMAGRPAEALPLLNDAWDRARGNPRVSPDRKVTILFNLGRAYRSAGRPADAVPFAEQAHQLARTQLGPEDQGTVNAMFLLALLYRETGKKADAQPLLQEALRQKRSRLGEDHPGTLRTLEGLALSYYDEKRLPEAIKLFEEVLRLREARFGAEDPASFTSVDYLAECYRQVGRHADAVRLLDIGLKLARLKYGPEDARTLGILFRKGLLLSLMGQHAEGLPLLEEAHALHKAKLGADHRETLLLLDNLGDAYRRAGRSAKARRAYEECITLKSSKFGPQEVTTQSTMTKLANLHDERGEHDRAEPWRRRVVAACRVRNDDGVRLANALANLGWSLLQGRKCVEAEPVLRESLALRQRKEAEGWRLASTRRMLGAALAGQRKFRAAEPLLLAGQRGLVEHEAKIPDSARKRQLTEAFEGLIQLYDAWGKKEEAAKWRNEWEAHKKKQSGAKADEESG